jgi:ribosomal protein S18 acetylase RimI-like enzyme
MFQKNYKTILRIVLGKLHFPKKNRSQENIDRAEKKAPPKEGLNDFQPQIGIVGIGVNPQYQGKGYGSALIQQCVAYCKANGFTTIDLSVHHDNAQAIAAYKRNGFETICLKEDGDLFMKLTI